MKAAPLCFAACGVLALSAGCANVAQVTSISEPSCREFVELAFVRTFTGQGESEEVAARLAVGLDEMERTPQLPQRTQLA